MLVAEHCLTRMHSSMTRFSRTTSLFALFALAAAAKLTAQTDSLVPHRGTWGAEMPVFVSGGSLLRFTSPSTAWLAGLSFGVAGQRIPSGPFNDGSSSTSYFRGQLGHRWYTPTGDGDIAHLRATYGAGLVGALTHNGNGDQSSQSWNAGGYGEFGATWFFTRHLSIGAIGTLQATWAKDRQRTTIFSGQGTPETRVTQTSNSWSVGADLMRVTAAVYF
jgi:hypothetical protein